MSIVVSCGPGVDNLPSDEDLPGDFIIDYVRAYQKQWQMTPKIKKNLIEDLTKLVKIINTDDTRAHTVSLHTNRNIIRIQSESVINVFDCSIIDIIVRTINLYKLNYFMQAYGDKLQMIISK